MKILGIILIVIQILGYVTGRFDSSQSIAFLIGFNLWGIIGLALLIVADYKKNKKTVSETELKGKTENVETNSSIIEANSLVNLDFSSKNLNISANPVNDSHSVNHFFGVIFISFGILCFLKNVRLSNSSKELDMLCEVVQFTRTQNSLVLNNNDTCFHSLLGFDS